MGLFGTARTDAGAVEIRLDPGSADASARDESHSGMQLAAGPFEGGLDTSHAPIMHRLLSDRAKRGGIKPSTPMCAPRRPTSSSTSPITAINTLGSDRSAPMRGTSVPIISFCRSIRCAPRRRSAISRPMRATSGCRSTMRPQWSIIGHARQRGRLKSLRSE